MIIPQSKLKICDNSGVKIVKCIKIYLGSIGYVGSSILTSIKSIKSKSKLRKGDIAKGIIIRTKHTLDRKSGIYVSFDSNDIVLLNNKLEPLGTRIFGPLTLELRKKSFVKLLSLGGTLV